ncbi:hypothetical protein SELMODRAFT_415949 [Selaginella moellendorffii]|uniref:Uncharacterized protein n=1 Tax=Selaginella moellendorffii TaxID=88036 RepID=D8RXM0_SELML|nr:hypothetical protein SELMODRAFT_415949 [Selaginella moellendorffii]
MEPALGMLQGRRASITKSSYKARVPLATQIFTSLMGDQEGTDRSVVAGCRQQRRTVVIASCLESACFNVNGSHCLAKAFGMPYVVVSSLEELNPGGLIQLTTITSDTHIEAGCSTSSVCFYILFLARWKRNHTIHCSMNEGATQSFATLLNKQFGSQHDSEARNQLKASKILHSKMQQHKRHHFRSTPRKFQAKIEEEKVVTTHKVLQVDEVAKADGICPSKLFAQRISQVCGLTM